MDTKSKNTKRYPLFVKALCVLLSLLCFLGTAYCGIFAALSIVADDADFNHPFSSTTHDFYDTEKFRNILRSDLLALSDIASYPVLIKKLAAAEADRDSIIQTQYDRFLSKKASIIQAEIYYVATHYDQIEDGDYYYEAYMRDFSTTTTAPVPAQDAPTTAAAEDVTTAVTKPSEKTIGSADDTLDALPKLKVDERAPYNVRYCQKLINTVTGLDWLQYASLVRNDAFLEQNFRPAFGDLGEDFSSVSLSLGEAEALASITQLFDEQVQTWRMKYDASRQAAETRLSEAVNMHYLVKTKDGSTYTNMTTPQSAAQNAAVNRSIVWQSGKLTVFPHDAESKSEIASLMQSVALYTPDGEPFDLTVIFSEPIQPGDRYAEASEQYAMLSRFTPKTVLCVGIGCAFGLLFSFIVLLCLCGHKSGAEGITLAFIDRMPTDLHFLMSAAAAALGFVLLIITGKMLYDWWMSAVTNYVDWLILWVLPPVSLSAIWLVFVEWLTSTVRIKKAGQSYFKRFVLWKIVPLILKCVRFVFGKVKKAVLYLLEKPKKIRYIFILATALYVVVNFIWIGIAAGGMDAPGLALFGFLVLSVAYVLFYLRYLRTLDRIIDLSSDRTALPIPDTDSMPPALRTLAENMSFTQNELNKAVAQAVRNERTKTELITNVSHDLKTPLTSVISYVDLLKQCDITDETAKGYLEILDEKSANLKRLIEDLIEASKVSTGNVTLNCVPLNLAELAMQAVVEATPELEAQGLEIKFAPSDNAPIIFADSGKTYRVLENLLSNVKKYAAGASRVYIRVWEDTRYGVFEIKNISAQPLDIDPQELLERFVRGDRSRSNEGNGLGLSIAQQLCTLQGGRLDIQIDGDLFKASVYLPKQNAAEGSNLKA